MERKLKAKDKHYHVIIAQVFCSLYQDKELKEKLTQQIPQEVCSLEDVVLNISKEIALKILKERA